MLVEQEVFTLAPKPNFDPGQENQSIFPIPGDPSLCYQPEGHEPKELAAHVQADKITTKDRHIPIWYGRGSVLTLPTGTQPSNHFGEIVNGLMGFATTCERIRFEGINPIPYRIVGQP